MKQLITTPSILLLIFLSGCMQGSYRNYTDINGTIENGRFHDPLGRFTIEVPYLVQPGAVIRGRFEEEGGTIEFSDDLGKLIRLDVSTATDPTSEAMLHNPDWKAVFSQNRAFMQGLYRTVSPKAKIIHQEYMLSDSKHIDFFVFSMPEGSTLADAKSRKRHDAIRASISLLENDSLFTLTTQQIPGIWRQNENENEMISRMKDTLLETLKTMSFEKKEN